MTAPLAHLPRADLLDSFEIPPALEAGGPPEARGLPRDGVRLMTTTADGIEHRRFSELASILHRGDLLVVNVSATLPAAVDVGDGRVVHFSTRIPGGFQIVEIRRRVGVGTERLAGVKPGPVHLPGGGMIDLLAPYPADSESGRLWLADVSVPCSLREYLNKMGKPISYSHIEEPLPLESYQTVFATSPGSTEMPSAGRPFSLRMLAELVASGIVVAPVTLHTGVSSLEPGEAPYPEWFHVPDETSALINHARRNGRVVAVGTTVVRALETTADETGASHPGEGWTDLFVDSTHTMRVVDGLITGWHEPNSTHLAMLTALAGRSPIVSSYAEAMENGYLWHEFGDSHLILPD